MAKKKREVRITKVERYPFTMNERHVYFEWFRDGHLHRGKITARDGEDAWALIAKWVESDDSKLLDQVREV